MKVQAVIDRFEGNKAVLLLGEQETKVVWPKEIMPSEVQEGDILQVDLQIDREATEFARAEAESLLQRVLSKNQDG